MLHNNHWQYVMEYVNLCLSAMALLSEFVFENEVKVNSHHIFKPFSISVKR